MAKIKALLFISTIVAASLPCGLSASNTVPAFLWSSHRSGQSDYGTKEVVNYHTIPSKELAHFVLSEGGWLNHVCYGEKFEQDVDVALIFLGRKLQSSDLSRKAFADSSLIDFLEQTFSSSNFSMALPYVTKSNNEERIENSLISGFSENCANGLKREQIAVSEACSINNNDFTRLTDVDSVQDYVTSKGDSRMEEKASIIVYCSGDSGESQSEGDVLAKLISFMKKLGVKYSVLYASDPIQQIGYGTQKIPYRYLVEGMTNASVTSQSCDGVCQIKSSLLEGFFVAIVLLIILISGLCCMMGIDTPSRFETPQDS